MDTADSAKVELDSLIGLFYPDREKLGQFVECAAESLPQPQQSLLAHDFHMTVTLEKFHSTPVDVQVLDSRIDDNYYSRKILLSRKSDGEVVQFGIVRLNFDVLQPNVVEEIKAKETPLGRILINHDLLRRVKLLSLYEIQSEEISTTVRKQPGPVYGRTALIYLNETPAIELLEVVV